MQEVGKEVPTRCEAAPSADSEQPYTTKSSINTVFAGNEQQPWGGNVELMKLLAHNDIRY